MMLEFEPKIINGKVWDGEWVSLCGDYTISTYEYKDMKPCKAYCIGYRKIDGKRLTSESSSLSKVMSELNTEASLWEAV